MSVKEHIQDTCVDLCSFHDAYPESKSSKPAPASALRLYCFWAGCAASVLHTCTSLCIFQSYVCLKGTL
jgi:hypothetical protein